MITLKIEPKVSEVSKIENLWFLDDTEKICFTQNFNQSRGCVSQYQHRKTKQKKKSGIFLFSFSKILMARVLFLHIVFIIAKKKYIFRKKSYQKCIKLENGKR